MQAERDRRYLIVNADDFGLTGGINRGVIEAHERGIVTSASMMVRYSGVREAAAYAQTHPSLSVGLHFETAEWRFNDGAWRAHYEVAESHDAQQVRAEFERQLAEFERILGRPPTHLDSHQHVHQSEPARSILSAYAAQLGIPLRGCGAAIVYCGRFYGQTGEGGLFPEGISIGRLIGVVETLEPGWTEVGCHPGYSNGLDSIYTTEREEELRVLCSEEVRGALERNRVRLRSFLDFTNGAANPGLAVES